MYKFVLKFMVRKCECATGIVELNLKFRYIYISWRSINCVTYNLVMFCVQTICTLYFYSKFSDHSTSIYEWSKNNAERMQQIDTIWFDFWCNWNWCGNDAFVQWIKLRILSFYYRVIKFKWYVQTAHQKHFRQ